MIFFPIQVLRYSALVAGLVYGVWHQSSLNSQAKRAEIDREYKHKESLIEQAKAEWKRKTAPPQQKTNGGRTSTELASYLLPGGATADLKLQ
jgi:F-type H+-transporting ATP synthase subunit e